MFDKYNANKIRFKSPSSIIRFFYFNKDSENLNDKGNKINTDLHNVNINITNNEVDYFIEGKINVENLIKEYIEKYGEEGE